MKINKRIVITGAPGSGKSSLCDELEKMGYKVIPEPARIVIEHLKENDPVMLEPQNMDSFQDMIEERDYKNYIEHENGIFDRCIIDAMSFRRYYKCSIPESSIDKCKTSKYDKIFILPPCEHIYVNDGVRRESYQQALDLHTVIYDSYVEFGYEPIEVPFMPISDRVKYILDMID